MSGINFLSYETQVEDLIGEVRARMPRASTVAVPAAAFVPGWH